MKLSNFFASRHDKRREYEWKISFAFWTLIVGAILEKPNLPVLREPCAALVGVILGIIFTLTWIRGVYVANQKDKDASFFYADRAKELVLRQAEPSVSVMDQFCDRIRKKEKNSSWEFWIACFAFLCHLSKRLKKQPWWKFWFAFLFKWSHFFHVIVTATLIIAFILVDPEHINLSAPWRQ